MKPWGRVATFGLGVVALLAGQAAVLAVLARWYGGTLTGLSDIAGDGVAVTLTIAVSTVIQVTLLWFFAHRAGDPVDYLGLVPPRRSDVIVGAVAVVLFIVLGNAVSLLFGKNIVTSFQNDIYRSASAAGSLALLWLAIVAVAPVGEEMLFRGFLFRGWARNPRDVWPTIIVTALLFALMHVQYDWFVIAQVFAFGVLLGWMRWASGSTILTMMLHALVNLEGMIETFVAQH